MLAMLITVISQGEAHSIRLWQKGMHENPSMTFGTLLLAHAINYCFAAYYHANQSRFLCAHINRISI